MLVALVPHRPRGRRGGARRGGVPYPADRPADAQPVAGRLDRLSDPPCRRAARANGMGTRRRHGGRRRTRRIGLPAVADTVHPDAAGPARGMAAGPGPTAPPAADRLRRRRSNRSGGPRHATGTITPGQGAPQCRGQAVARRAGRAPRRLVDRPDGSDHHRGVQGRRVRHAAARASAAYCAGHGAGAHRAGRPAARTPRCPRSRRRRSRDRGPGALRSVFDSCTARSGLSTAYLGTGAPATATDGSGSTSTSRGVALSSATVDALEALTATVASGHRHGRHAAAPKPARGPRG